MLTIAEQVGSGTVVGTPSRYSVIGPPDHTAVLSPAKGETVATV
jgi:hypothetical protein